MNHDKDELGPAPHVTCDVATDLFNMHRRFKFHGKKFDKKALLHRIEFLQEELDEIRAAVANKDSASVLDGLVDIVVVAVGTADLAGASFQRAWREVMKKNNQKLVGFNKTRPNSEGVDLIKPDGWTPPDLSDCVGNLPDILFGDTVMSIHETLPEPEDRRKDQTSRRAISVLEECIDLMRMKSQDYNSQESSVKAADYYPNGVDDLLYMIDVVKRLRLESVLSKLKNGQSENFESLSDTIKDRIVYLSFLAEWVDKKMQGQDPNKDIWNREIPSSV